MDSVFRMAELPVLPVRCRTAELVAGAVRAAVTGPAELSEGAPSAELAVRWRSCRIGSAELSGAVRAAGPRLVELSEGGRPRSLP